MKLPAIISVWGWLVRDTFRQSLAYGIYWILLSVSLLCILICLSVGVSGSSALSSPGEQPEFLPRHDAEVHKAEQYKVPVVRGELTIGFGAWHIPLARDDRSAVRFLQLVLAGGVADTLGLLLTLIWTAGFLPGFLEDRAVSILLAKPLARWQLLAGKVLGVLTFVLFHATLFVGGTWFALGLRTGIWDKAYLLCIPILLLQFAIFFGFSLLLAVCTRSTVVCVFGSIVFWAICWGMNYGRHAVAAEAYVEAHTTLSPTLMALVDTAYWIMPKPADLGIVLYDVLEGGRAFGKLNEFATVQSHGGFHPWLSVVSSLAFLGVLWLAAKQQFAAADY